MSYDSSSDAALSLAVQWRGREAKTEEATMFSIAHLAERWSSRWAIHALPSFAVPNPIVRKRRNAAWNWGFLLAQAIALTAHATDRPGACGPSALVGAGAFAIAVYGWIDLSLCLIRKTFLLHLRAASTSDASDRIGSAWLMFVSLTLVYANLYFVVGQFGGEFKNALDSPVAALALSASTMTTVGYGYYSPISGVPVVLTFFQALSGLALVSCIIAAAVATALSPATPRVEGAPAATQATSSFACWLILFAVVVPSIVVVMAAGCR